MFEGFRLRSRVVSTITYCGEHCGRGNFSVLTCFASDTSSVYYSVRCSLQSCKQKKKSFMVLKMLICNLTHLANTCLFFFRTRGHLVGNPFVKKKKKKKNTWCSHTGMDQDGHVLPLMRPQNNSHTICIH